MKKSIEIKGAYSALNDKPKGEQAKRIYGECLERGMCAMQAEIHANNSLFYAGFDVWRNGAAEFHATAI